MANKKEVIITCNATNVKAVIEGLERGMAALAKEEEKLLNTIKARGYAENDEKKRPLHDREEYLAQIEHNEKYTGVPSKMMYFGTGDYGGSATDESAKMLNDAVDQNGDVLPVLRISDMLTGPPAVAQLVENRLKLFAGEWWENSEWGNEILRMLQEGRLTGADAQSLSTYLSSYVRKTTGVQDVREEKWTISGGRFSWSCTVLTENGQVEVHYEL